MNLVLGLSMTSSSVRWVLVEGTTGEGATLDRGSLAVASAEAFDAEALLNSLFEAAGTRRIHAIGLTWTGSAEATSSAVWQALTDRQVENVIAVSDLEAAEALTGGIAEIAGYERVAVCVVEPGGAVVAAVTSDGVSADRVAAVTPGDIDGFSPDVVFVVGSGDVTSVVADLEKNAEARVISADEADLALARGSALAAASAVSILDAQITPARRQFSPTAMLASVLAAAVVVFVVSLSAVLGMSMVPEKAYSEASEHSEASVPESESTTPASPAKAAPHPPKTPAPPEPEVPAPAEPVAVAVPVPDAGLIVDQPEGPPPAELQEDPLVPPDGVAPELEDVPDAPNYVSPPPPSAPEPPYVPPVLPGT